MANMYGHNITPGKTADFHPIGVEEISPGVWALKTAVVSVGAGTAGVANHYNGSANIASANVAFTATTKSILITNTDAVETLQVSFDSGTNYYDIDSGESLSVLAAHSSIDIQATANGTTYQILTTE